MKSNERGFTLIETMIAAGLGMLVLYSIFNIHHTMIKTQVTSSSNLEVADLRYEVAGTLAQVDKCSNLLGGLKSATGTALTISSNIKANSRYGNVRITSVTLQNIKTYGADKRSASIQVAGTRFGINTVKSNFTELFHIYYSVNSSGNIVTCKDNVSVCSSMGGVWKTDHCDFCANLGGTAQADGTCVQKP